MTDLDLSEAVARKLGWELREIILNRERGYEWMPPGEITTLTFIGVHPRYAIDIEACFRDVVPKIKRFGLVCDRTGEWTCWSADKLDFCEGATPAEAICKAFLAIEDE